MAYRINKTDGSVLTDVIDGTIDQITTDLTLIGSDVAGYGELLNENFVKLLENFADVDIPQNPITGQLWYDLSGNMLKIYNGSQFVRVAGATFDTGSKYYGVPDTSTIVPGDLWIDTTNGQLWFHDGTGVRLSGPIYTKNQNVSGFQVKTIDNNVVVCLMCNGILMGFFSRVTFQPTTSLYGYTGTIKAGYTFIDDSNTLLFPLYIKELNLYDTTVDNTAKIAINHDTAQLDIIVPAPNNAEGYGNINVSGSAIVGLPAIPTTKTSAITAEWMVPTMFIDVVDITVGDREGFITKYINWNYNPDNCPLEMTARILIKNSTNSDDLEYREYRVSMVSSKHEWLMTAQGSFRDLIV